MSSWKPLLRHDIRLRGSCLQPLPPGAKRLNSTKPRSHLQKNASKGETDSTVTLDGNANSKSVSGPVSSGLNYLSSPVRFYARAQAKRPYVTQIVSSLIVYLAGDLIAQNLPNSEANEPYDLSRSFRALVIGGVVAVPGYKWFVWLGSSFNYRSRVLSISIKVAMTQLIFTPTFIVYFFAMQSALAGSNPKEIVERLFNTVPSSLTNSFKFWPAVNTINFAFVPLHYRSIFASVAAIGWQTYLSLLNQSAARLERQIREQKAM